MSDRPTEDEMLLEVARVIAQRGTCSRGQTGAVVALRGRVLSTGYNGTPSGMPHCDHSCDCRGRFNLRDPRSHHPSCNSMMPCRIAVHAEANAVAFAAHHGVQLEGATIYCVLSPCLACAMLIINAGITRVVCLMEKEQWKPGDTSVGTGIELLDQAGIEQDVIAVTRLEAFR